MTEIMAGRETRGYHALQEVDNTMDYDTWFAEVAAVIKVTAGINAGDIIAPYVTMYQGGYVPRQAAVEALNQALADGLITWADVQYYASFGNGGNNEH
jgi:hypothetical protein